MERNRKIDWHVENINVMSDMGDNHPTFHAHLTGTPDPLFSGRVGDVVEDLQRYLAKMEDVESLWPKTNPYLEMVVGRCNGKTAATAAQWNLYRDLVLTAPRLISQIKKVIFNDPATIVIWSDDTKTIVKCQENDIFDPEKGLAMAISKKALGNKGNYCNEIKKWTEKYEEEQEQLRETQVHSKEWAAYWRLRNALNDPEATKKDLLIAMEEAVGYLGEGLDK